MTTIFDFILNNMYLYICIIIGLIILNSILIILALNRYKRIKINNDYIEATKNEEKLQEEKTEPNELELLLQKMQEDINVKPEDVVKNFEQEQEDNAIISYQELVDNVKSGKIEIVDDDKGDVNFVEGLLPEDEPIMAIEELPEDEPKVTPQMVKDAIESIENDKVVEETKKFKKSDVISPVFGRMDESEIEYPTIKKTDVTLDLFNTKDYNELTDEIKRQEEFLNALKEFRKNLS